MTYRHFNRVSAVMVGIVLAAQVVGLLVLPSPVFATQCDGSAGPTCLTKCCPDASGTLQCSGLPVNGSCPSVAQTTQTSDTPGADADAEAAAAPAQESVGFIPLTDLPGLREVANSSSIPVFLNNIYKLCIGAAAVLAVLQIMRGGITYMMGDSITEKKEARGLILMSVVGLLLVLSPVIVFGLIDPRILNLQINFGSLQGNPTPVTTAPVNNGTVDQRQQVIDNCGEQEGRLVLQADGRYRCDIPSAQGSNSGTQISQDGTSMNYLNLPTTAGHYMLVLMKFDETQEPRCLGFGYKTFATQAACSAASPSIRSSHTGWGLHTSCEVTPSSTYRIATENPICSAVETF